MTQTRDNQDNKDKPKRSTRGILPLIGLLALIGVALYLFGDKGASTDVVEPSSTSTKSVGMSDEDRRVKARMESPEYIRAQELAVKTDILKGDIDTEKRLLNGQLNQAKTDHDDAIREIERAYASSTEEMKSNSRDKIKDIEGKLEEVRKEELKLASTTLSLKE